MDYSLEPKLLTASSCSRAFQNIFAFNSKFNSDLTVSNDQKTVEWVSNITYAWLGIETLLTLYDGRFSMDFNIDSMQNYQMGVGFLLLLELPNGETDCDWGFYGYLGSSASAFSYDPSSGDIVSHTDEIISGLPILKGDSGVITLELNLPKESKGEAWFLIDGVETPHIELPLGAVVRPAACLLRKKQKITLDRFLKK